MSQASAYPYDQNSLFSTPSRAQDEEITSPKLPAWIEANEDDPGLHVTDIRGESIGYGHVSNVPLSHDLEGEGEKVHPRPRKYCGLSRKLAFGVLVVITLVALGLILGLYFGLKKSKGGAEKGSGAVAIDIGEHVPLINLYYQDNAGNIRQHVYQNGIWDANNNIVVASNARDGGPLMAVTYTMNEETTWRVIYINKEDFLEEAISSNKSTGWTTGPLGSGRFKASDSSGVGLSACWHDYWYGYNNNKTGGGIRLYYGSAEGSIKELGWSYGSTAWDSWSTFPDTNPDGGVECTVRGLSITNVWLLNTNGELEQRWYDFNTSARTANHSTNTWVKGLTHSNVLTNSAISAISISNNTQKFIHYQQPDGKIIQLLATGTAETSEWTDDNGLYSVGAGTLGTRIGSVVLSTAEGGREIHVFFQTKDHNLMDYVRTLDGSTWSPQALIE
ncbi:hypothetical protein MMC24_007349 [Lignoscripta atroalba]|nr:hypothetical protein [Lignoscripta atroalba]